MCPLGADCIIKDGKHICVKDGKPIKTCEQEKCSIRPLAKCPKCHGPNMEVTADGKDFYIECYNFNDIPCPFDNFRSSFKSCAETCLEFDRKYLKMN